MTANRLPGQRLAHLLVRALAWVRGQSVLRDVYRQLPAALRAPLSRRLDAAVHRRLRFPRNANWTRNAPPAPLEPVAADAGLSSGVNVFGYLSGEFGLAESARLYSRALMDARTPVSFFNTELELPHGMRDNSFSRLVGELTPYGVNLLFVNPDYLDQAEAKIGEERLRGKPSVACWFWELPKIPAEWRPAIARMDAIVVASEFVADAFRQVADIPVLHVPLPVYPASDSGLTRRDLGMSEDGFHFLCMFDFHSWVARKNPHGVIEAFQRAFPGRQDVRLMVKSSNGHLHWEALRELLDRVAADPRITVRDDIIAKPHLQSLMRCCDAFVSLHRAEGFGLVMAEAMALGKPVIATRWSGNLDFMDDSNSYLVQARLRPVLDGEYPHEPGDVWAEPDIEDAARHMWRLADDPDAARRLGETARDDVLVRLNPRAIGRRLADAMATVRIRQGAPTT